MTCAATRRADQDKKAMIQGYIGLIFSNVKVYRTKLALVLWSSLGNSGKTQVPNLVGELLGIDKVANIPIRQMNEVFEFTLGNIAGKRLISIGGQASSEIKDSSAFKQIIGGDAVKIEPKNKQPFYYIFPGGTAIARNNLPNFQGDKGGHMLERLCMASCTNTIEHERQDSALLDKILNERNAIFNWFPEGLRRLADRNSKIIRSSAHEGTIKDYREKLDAVSRYLSEFYVVTEDKADTVVKADLDRAYMNWCVLNEFAHVNKQNIRDRMEANGCPVDKTNIEGKRSMMAYRKSIHKG